MPRCILARSFEDGEYCSFDGLLGEDTDPLCLSEYCGVDGRCTQPGGFEELCREDEDCYEENGFCYLNICGRYGETSCRSDVDDYPGYCCRNDSDCPDWAECDVTGMCLQS